MEPTPAQIETVYTQWNSVNKIDFTEDMYQEMFVVHPQWRALFMFKNYQEHPDRKETRWRKQFVITSNALDRAIRLANFSFLDEVLSYLHELAQRHVVHNVGQEEFKAVKPIIMAVVRRRITDADVDAWKTVINFLVDKIV